MRTREWAERRVRGGGGAGARPFVHSSTTFSQRHCTPRPHRCSCALASTRPSAERDAPDRPLASAHSFACAAVPLRHAQPGRTNTFRGHAQGTKDALRMRLPAHSAGPHARCCRPKLCWRRRRRCVPSHCASGCAVAPASVHGVPIASELPAARAPFSGLFLSVNNLRAFPAVKKNCAERPKIGCAQLAAIKRDAAAAALVADVTAKNLDASTVDLLLIVKVRCRRCAPLSALGCRSIPRSATLAGVLEYPWSTHECSRSTHEHHCLRWSAPQRGGVRIACHAAAVATLERRYPNVP